jgi:hypothetical protein
VIDSPTLLESLRFAVALAIVGFLASVLAAILEDVARRWQTGTLLKPPFETPIFWIAAGVVAALIALYLLLAVISIIWAWITLPFTLRADVAAVNGLRLEVQRLREQLRPAAVVPTTTWTSVTTRDAAGARFSPFDFRYFMVAGARFELWKRPLRFEFLLSY